MPVIRRLTGNPTTLNEGELAININTGNLFVGGVSATSAGDGLTAETIYVVQTNVGALEKWLDPVLDVQIDGVLNPGATPTAGNRYLITDIAALHANFDTITIPVAVANGDVVEFISDEFHVVYDASASAEGALTYDLTGNRLLMQTGVGALAGWADITPGGGLQIAYNNGNAVTANATDGGVAVTITSNGAAATVPALLAAASGAAGTIPFGVIVSNEAGTISTALVYAKNFDTTTAEPSLGVAILQNDSNAGTLPALLTIQNEAAGTLVATNGLLRIIQDNVALDNPCILLDQAGDACDIAMTDAVTKPTPANVPEGGFGYTQDNGGRLYAKDTSGDLQDYAYLIEAQDKGSAATFTLLFATQPADGDTVTVGADVYEFVDTAVNTVVNNDTRIAVPLGVAIANTRALFVDAVNGAAVDAGITMADLVTPALFNGTEDLLATEVGATVTFISATVPGGTVVAADPSIVLAEALTDIADVWDVGNVNVNTLAGRAAGSRDHATVSMPITADMITNGVSFQFTFTPSNMIVQVRSAAGVILAPGTDAFTISGTRVNATFGGGIAPDIQATDIVTIQVSA